MAANNNKKSKISYSKLHPDGNVRVSEYANTAVKSSSKILGEITRRKGKA